MLAALWEWKRKRVVRNESENQNPYKEAPPKWLAVLSFAGLDTYDSLLLPLLAHEVGHFIVASFPEKSDELDAAVSAVLSTAEVAKIAKRHKQPHLDRDAKRRLRPLTIRAAGCLRELLADALAVRMMGFAFFAAQAEFLKTIPQLGDGLFLHDSSYPALDFRLAVILKQLRDPKFPGNIERILGGKKSPAKWPSSLQLARVYLDRCAKKRTVRSNGDWRSAFGATGGASAVELELLQLAERAVSESVEKVYGIASELIPDERCVRPTQRIFERVERLEHDLPPTLRPENQSSFAEMLMAAWLYQLSTGEARERKEKASTDQLSQYQITCRLVQKAAELTTVESPALESVRNRREGQTGAVLSGPHISARLRRPVTDEKHLAVVPYRADSVDGASLDVHLGHWFVVAKRTRLSSVKLNDPLAERLLRTIGREEEFVAKNNHFLIHPGDFVLGATLEFVALPPDLMAFVEGRSSLGRSGLIVATASQVAPGFHGVIVLELANAGTVPLELEPGMRIAQLVFQKMTSRTKPYRKRFYCQIKP